MSAALIPARLVPIARTDADWAFDITFQDEDWTGSEVRVAFARQGLPADKFEVVASAATTDLACAIRLTAADLADLAPGTYSAEVRRILGDDVDDAAVFEMRLVQGLSDLDGVRGAPKVEGDGMATGGVIVSRQHVVTVVRAAGVAGHTPTPEEIDALVAPQVAAAVAPYQAALDDLAARVAALEEGGGAPPGFVAVTHLGQTVTNNGVAVYVRSA